LLKLIKRKIFNFFFIVLMMFPITNR
jgi:hypothetical protein